MHPVYLLEDNPSQLQAITGIIEDYILFHDASFYLAKASSDPQAIVAAFPDQPSQPGLYFLDIEIEGQAEGLALAQEIKHLDPFGRVAFITAHPSYAPLTLKHHLEPLAYIHKEDFDSLRQEIIICFELFYQRLYPGQETKTPNIQIKSGSQTYLVDPKDLFSIQTTQKPHILEFTTRSSTLQSYGALKDFDQLPGFFRLSQSALVNLDLVDQVAPLKRRVTLSNGQVFSFSRKYRASLNQALAERKARSDQKDN
ncbi:LytR/AlgR family response regulator transcription factor [Aerococcus sanguinicola]|uniref:LytR/AlgR family response regulator transcription factor n=1 Tax=Aerococcus sanguinicola TaxID=119206 RepID=UPI0018A7D9FD|nr:LytTR family DNA-binding domain-containing protein [Aerococcus sanguinicola]